MQCPHVYTVAKINRELQYQHQELACKMVVMTALTTDVFDSSFKFSRSRFPTFCVLYKLPAAHAHIPRAARARFRAQIVYARVRGHVVRRHYAELGITRHTFLFCKQGNPPTWIHIYLITTKVG